MLLSDVVVTSAELAAMRREAGMLDPAPADVVLIQASSIRPEPIRWLWGGWMARGKFHLLAGRPGQGKTMLALGLAATVTTAGRWPDGTRCPETGQVVIWSGEDDPKDTLVPRLMAAGADLERVHFVGDRTDGSPFDPANDLPLLAEKMRRLRPALLIVDPIVSAVAADSHKNGEVRRALQPLVDMAAAVDCAVLGITHLSKGTTGREPVERITGSIAFGAIARVVLLATKREDPPPGEAPRLLVRAKSNIGPDEGGCTYDLEQVRIEGDLYATRVTWGAPVEGPARELLAQAESVPGEEDDGGTLGDAMRFLRNLLADGPLPQKQIMDDARGAGYSETTIRRAKQRLGVEAVKEGGYFGGHKQQWAWRLPPEDDQENLKMPTFQRLSTFKEADHLLAPEKPLADQDQAEGTDEERF
ncbi:AAA family ATPase [Thiofaba sp. EF100]|jgi:putative DNA primase/helicase|uniref:AAA family ATPase n=1 Tax=Thiofaba sp. EF100 TaxID=3121274 RepID=UPI0032214996